MPLYLKLNRCYFVKPAADNLLVQGDVFQVFSSRKEDQLVQALVSDGVFAPDELVNETQIAVFSLLLF